MATSAVPAQEHCTVEHLVEVLEGCQEEIISEWRSKASELLRDLKLDKPTITDHLPDLIAEITRDLAFSHAGVLSVEHAAGSPPVHECSVFTMASMWVKSW